MATFGKNSLAKRSTLHPDLQRLCDEVIKHVDYSITCGFRGEAEQNKAVAEGKSTTPWPKSKHNAAPSRAVDVAPYPVNWNDNESFSVLAGVFLGVAKMMGINIRIGADWDGDFNVLEHSFKDLPHIELA